MKILFFTLGAISTIKERGIYNDLMREFVRRGHEPYLVIAAERRYNLPEEVVEEDGIKMLRVKTLNIRKSNIIEKGIGTILVESQYKRAIKRHWGDVKFDLCLYSTPPITFNNVVAWQKKKGVPTYLLLKDIFPQNAVDLGMFSKGSIFYKYFRKKEKKLYSLSDYIGCMSPANVKYVLDHNPEIDPNTVEVCPNSLKIISEDSVDGNRKNILDKYNVPKDKPLFIYGGNLGKPQGIDFLIKILEETKERTDFHFCIVGSGTELPKLKSWKESNRNSNVTLMEYIPKEDYDLLVKAADVGMIFLDNRFTIPNFPSRLLSYLECKMPVVLATDANTDMGRIAEDNQFGLWSESGDIEGFMFNLDKLAADSELRKVMGGNGFKFLEDNYTVEKSADTILGHFELGSMFPQ